MTGKEKCQYLKELRVKAAEQYGIKYNPHECNNDGECSGTCQMCEFELNELTWKIHEKMGIPFENVSRADEEERLEEERNINSVFYNRKYSNPFALRGCIVEDD